MVYAGNVGGGATTLDGVEYKADRFATGGTSNTTSDPINDVTQDTLYQSERYGALKYEIPVTNSTYSLKLHFVEMYQTASGERSFNVTVEGEPVIQNIDLFDEVGHDTAYEFIVEEVMVADESLTIELTAVIENPTLSGFAIYSNAGGQYVEPPEPEGCDLPNNLSWTSTGPIISPPPGAASIKDPTIVRYDGRYHVFATIFNGNYTSVYMNFTDWSNAGNAQISNFNPTYNGRSSATVAPQVFFFEPQNRWYVFTQWPARYTSTTDISNPNGWSAMQNIWSNYDPPGNDLDYWVICDDSTCYLYWWNDTGITFYVKTPIGNFPNFPSNAMQANVEGGGPQSILFEAGNIYKIQGTDQYMMQVEGWPGGNEGGRIYRSWTSTSLDGPWRRHLTSDNNPFAGVVNTSFPQGQWTLQISHGEMIRAGYDQKMELSACDMEFLYQGGDFRNHTGNYDQRPYQLGLLRQNN